MAGIRYSIKNSKIKRALLHGMEQKDDYSIGTTESEEMHYFVLPLLDSGMEDCPWGRLHFKLAMPENSICYLYVGACNEPIGKDIMLADDVPVLEKKKYLHSIKGLQFMNKQDVLLYEVTGRYLWVMVEMIGEGGCISYMKVEAPGDNFMQTFPEVYREQNSFFHRYLSIFSSIYNDFQEKIEDRMELLPIETAPLPLLELYAKWLGIDINGGYLEEATLRRLLLEAPELLKRKGTRFCIQRICMILLGEIPTIVERSQLQRFVRRDDRKQYDALYGDNPYDVTLLLNHYVEEKKKEQLFHLLGQFKPLRSRLHIVFLEPSGVLDEHIYMDENAFLFMQSEGTLDKAQIADGTIVLQ